MRLHLLTVAAVLAGLACQSSASGGSSSAPSGPVVATVGSEVITEEAFAHHLKEQSPFIRARYTTIDKKKEFLDSMIRFQLLASEARREGFDKDPEVVATVDKVMVQKLIHKKFGDEGSDKMPEADLHAYYDSHKDEYVKPERIRVQLIEFKGEAAGGAKKALAELQAAATKKDLAAFGAYASAHSDDGATKGRNGDTDFKTQQELTDTYGPGVAEAAGKLQQLNQLSDVAHGKDGYFLLRLIGRQAALDRTFDQVKSALQSRLWHERQNQAFEDHVKKLRAEANVKIDETELAKVDVTVPDLSGNGPGLALQGGRPPNSPPVAATPPSAGTWRPHSYPRGPHGRPPLQPMGAPSPAPTQGR